MFTIQARPRSGGPGPINRPGGKMVLALDIALSVCFFLTVIDGARNGFFREGFTLAGVGAGLWAAIGFTSPVQQKLPHWLRDAPAVGVVLFVLICGVVVTALRLTGFAFSAMWEGRKPSPPSRIAGLVLGSIRGLVLVLVLAAGLAMLFPPGSRFLGQSRLLPYLSPGIVWGTELLPQQLGDRILWRWGQLPFEDRLIRPGSTNRRGVSDKVAVRHESGVHLPPGCPEEGGIAVSWPFAS